MSPLVRPPTPDCATAADAAKVAFSAVWEPSLETVGPCELTARPAPLAFMDSTSTKTPKTQTFKARFFVLGKTGASVAVRHRLLKVEGFFGDSSLDGVEVEYRPAAGDRKLSERTYYDGPVGGPAGFLNCTRTLCTALAEAWAEAMAWVKADFGCR